MNFTTVFDGELPASLNPGVDPGAGVMVWEPTVAGGYNVMITAPDEPGAPFAFSPDTTVDPAGAPAFTSGPLGSGSNGQEFQVVPPDNGPDLWLATLLGHPVRVVVRVALIVSAETGTDGDTLVVSLDELKRGLGIALSDDSEDENLVQLEAQAVAWLEELLERRFREPAERVDYLKGRGTSTLFLWGNVEDGVVTMSERPIAGGAWEEVEDPTEVFELRPGARITKLERIDGSAWARGMEYKAVWNDGYTTAPADIRALVIDAVNQQRNSLIAINDEGTVKSETIGDYSYTLDLSVAAGALSAGFSNVSADTINRWRRVHR